ncbi:class I SAM-dependent methyltransferase [Deinococcus radiophilus]|uniref:Class I SAM-dependent methyltransferase n=1 Tax=Deinococcus radiophilus TaxID=32062 RepID=A0A3S0I293_9DEIO|nr:class I SAM-dependent methyltransferase [Deinococcus radiophilus]RTR25724.1 class I SAM-dependent methyltransferase [Deinococcus radiophilus]UFA50203.1 class I SAM-dependent methyltransferase [Deinococcus radiophilus]
MNAEPDLDLSHPDFGGQPLALLLPALRAALRAADEVSFIVPNPDLGLGLYAGESGPVGLHRSWAVWTDVADLLDAHLLTPRLLSGGTQVRLTLRRRSGALDTAQGYGPDSEFARADKLEDPAFLLSLVEALRRVAPPPGGRVLALGVNAGRELDALALAFPERASSLEVVGVDLDASALALAQRRQRAATFLTADVNALPAGLGRFDLVLALSVLQSPGVDLDRVLRSLHREHLTPGGGLVLGFPNARYRGGELSYGARLRNFARPDLSLLFADVAQSRRYLHKHGFKVFVTGKYEVLVTAIPAAARTPGDLEL